MARPAEGWRNLSADPNPTFAGERFFASTCLPKEDLFSYTAPGPSLPKSTLECSLLT